MKRGCCMALVVWLPIVLSTASAKDSPAIEELRAQLADQQQQIDRLQSENKGNDWTISAKRGLRIKSADGKTAFRVGGRLHLDSAFYQQDKRALGNGAEIRRARIYVSGRLNKRWRYRAEYDFSGNRTAVKDAWAGVFLSNGIRIKAGQFLAPFSLETLTSSNNILLTERALPAVFSPGYKVGISVAKGGENWGASGSGYGESVASDNGAALDSGWGAATRATWRPLGSGRNLWHVGTSIEYRELDSNQTIRLRTTPETHVAQTRLLDTDDISSVKSIQNIGVETAVQYGPVFMQAEYIHSGLQRNASKSSGKNRDLNFSGAYLAGSWMLTGEQRAYSVRNGVFKGINPRSDTGAWELVLRYSVLDLSDRKIDGGEEQNWALGVNWYPNSNVRLMANYIRAEADPSTAEVKPNSLRGATEKADILQFRWQIVF